MVSSGPPLLFLCLLLYNSSVPVFFFAYYCIFCLKGMYVCRFYGFSRLNASLYKSVCIKVRHDKTETDRVYSFPQNPVRLFSFKPYHPLSSVIAVKEQGLSKIFFRFSCFKIFVCRNVRGRLYVMSYHFDVNNTAFEMTPDQSMFYFRLLIVQEKIIFI